jgi:predicted HTH domain antitoxin
MVMPTDLVDAGLYRTEQEVILDAMRHLLLVHPGYRITLAVHRYQKDEGISLGKAAQLAGVSHEEMKEILADRGVQLRLGPKNKKEAIEEVATLRSHLNESHGE